MNKFKVVPLAIAIAAVLAVPVASAEDTSTGALPLLSVSKAKPAKANKKSHVTKKKGAAKSTKSTKASKKKVKKPVKKGKSRLPRATEPAPSQFERREVPVTPSVKPAETIPEKKEQPKPVAKPAEPAAAKGGATFTPRVYVGYMDYKFTLANTNYFKTVKRDMPFFGVGAKFAVDRFFVDAYAQASTKSSKQHDEYPLNSTWTYATDTEVKRQDYGITFGYGVLASPTGNLSVFAGYKAGKTTFDKPYAFNNVDPSKNILPSSATDTFKTNGPFIGVGYSLPISDGWLTFNAAVAGLKGKEKFTSSSVLSGYTTEENIKLKSVGATLGINWQAPLAGVKGLKYLVSLDGYSYEYKFRSGDFTTKDASGAVVDSGIILTGGDNKAKERVFSGKIGISYDF